MTMFGWFLLTISIHLVLMEEKQNGVEYKDGGKAPRIKLNDGYYMPAVGLGTFLGFDENGERQTNQGEVENQVSWGLRAGYRLIDTASAYHTEGQVGVAIRKSRLRRKHLYVVTKLGSHEQRHVLEALRTSLWRLNMSYVDLYLIHTPVAFKDDCKTYDVIDYLDTWKTMEAAKRLRLAKSIGVSNFNITQMRRLLANCDIKPAVLQVEVNLNLGQDNLLEFCKSSGIVVMANTPLGSMFDFRPGRPPPRRNHSTLVRMARKYRKTTSQIVLRYLKQRGVVPIPKSMNKERIEQNINIFDFQLSSHEMAILKMFNENYRTVVPSAWRGHPYCPYETTKDPMVRIIP
ncbi:aldo-keto reductase AKR2E4-like [Plodia interpunctella]|uniref:aldo-keto reductase AKR2E4-like n=1 Tax=Plodia interpunctella TaxID=58824 RepID=UPI0023689B28|nr:aldo-keto reductase AKR2E4-like [Plodia interpunctella]